MLIATRTFLLVSVSASWKIVLFCCFCFVTVLQVGVIINSGQKAHGEQSGMGMYM